MKSMWFLESRKYRGGREVGGGDRFGMRDGFCCCCCWFRLGWAGHTVAESAGFCSPASSCWSSGHVTRERKPSAVSVQRGMGEARRRESERGGGGRMSSAHPGSDSWVTDSARTHLCDALTAHINKHQPPTETHCKYTKICICETSCYLPGDVSRF